MLTELHDRSVQSQEDEPKEEKTKKLRMVSSWNENEKKEKITFQATSSTENKK